ncbi:MAG TPA: hypothetical protein VFX42_03750 [Gemmatimonadales bacterium]|nr:hypothetical protein [Gemmatimonadales bacterium]
MRIAHPFVAAAGLLTVPAALCAQAAKPASPQSDAAYIKAAEGGAPASISRDATIARLEKGGKVTVVREGSNGFTCASIPPMGIPAVCTDKPGWDWMVSAMAGKEKPNNDEPGVAYMMQGGSHFETADGKIVMEPSAKTKTMREPPHWMLLWPLDPAKTGLPTYPNAGGAYVMFSGTPYAHVMIYENPAKLKNLGKATNSKS